ncbi:Transcription factor LHW BHLH transcription factor [Vigna angularis]|uniref:Transcription factor LHW BHLH transcription factor n=1 Tax=Phaseolus angularis TaxID=3914 RepID=A0A8T0LBM7_PHAAN|nr:Transcription factor LHW BHLH transcription factor [Vigna angularis]
MQTQLVNEAFEGAEKDLVKCSCFSHQSLFVVGTAVDSEKICRLLVFNHLEDELRGISLTEYGLLVRLLIWEDHYYEPLPSPFPPRTVGVSNFPYRDGEGCWFSSESQLGIQEEDRVGGLINKMMLNNSVSTAGEGMVGRATFTGNYQWILMNNFSGDAYPPEVYSKLHYQFSAGM